MSASPANRGAARRQLLAVAVGLALLGLGGCGEEPRKPAFNGTDITGADYGRNFELPDHHGRLRRLADFRGKVVAVFFGYTQCPDVCPTTLAMLAEVSRQLGGAAQQLQVLFVTLDPERDTAALLAGYMPLFGEGFLGLRGDAAATARIAKEFRVFYRRSGEVSGTNYTVDHSTGLYVFDPQGRLRLYFRHGEAPQAVAADLRRLMTGE